jgi:O-antigen/teichoic acid export membrane protein
MTSDHGHVLRRAGTNFGWMAGSAGFSAVASLVYIALTARTLGPASFGTFALVMTYGELATNFAQFQSWKAVTSFGAVHQQSNNKLRLGRLFGYTASLDLLSGIIGSIVAVFGVLLLGPWLHWTPSQENAAMWFGTALLLTSSTTPAGMLRLFNRFDLQVWSEMVAQFTRLGGCLAGWLAGAGVGWFLGVWALAALLQLASQWAAALALGHRLSFGRRALRLTRHENRGLWPFMLKTNVSSTLSLFWMQCGTLIVGARAGAVEAGGFRLAHRFSLALTKPVEIAAKALSPELARLAADDAHRTMRTVLARVTWIASALAAIVVFAAILWGRQMLGLSVGRDFEFAQRFLVLLCIASAISVAGFALEPFLNAHFRAGTVLGTSIIAALLYGVLLFLLLPVFGAEAAALAAIAASFASVALLGLATARILAQPDARTDRKSNHHSGVFEALELPENEAQRL